MNSEKIFIANAPISYGAFELTVDIAPNVPDALSLLDLVLQAEYGGIDLGPVGYLGRGVELYDRLHERRLGLAGGYLELPFSDAEALSQGMIELNHLLDTFDEACTQFGPLPMPTLADAGAPYRRSVVGQSAHDKSLGLDDAAWGCFADGMANVVGHCRSRGYEPTLHPEAGTFVEAEWEVDRALAISDIGLCLETGHQLVGGGNPLASLERWGDRINHVHIKDARQSVIDEIVGESLPVENIWKKRAFCKLGDGDVAIDAILNKLNSLDYSGWIVVEQDIMPGPDDPADAHRAQIANRVLLHRNGF